MANFFSKLFNSEKKDTTYNGPKPYGSLTQAVGGQDYYDTILGRSKGQGVGYGEGYASKYANPIIQNSRERFNAYTMPELNSELTATGRRRGTSGFQQVAQAQKEQGLTEGDIFSQLQQRDEDLKRQEQSNAINQLGNFNKGDYDARNILSNFEYADNNRQVAEDATRRSNQAEGMNRMGSAAVQLAFGGSSPNPFTTVGPQTASYGGGDPSVGYGRSGNSYNQRIAQRYKMAQTGGFRR